MVAPLALIVRDVADNSKRETSQQEMTGRCLPYSLSDEVNVLWPDLLRGLGSGIGRATAVRLAREGAQVIGCDIAEPALVETKATLDHAGLTAALVTADVTNRRTSTGSWLRRDRASTSW
jgi:hypothetical protein